MTLQLSSHTDIANVIKTETSKSKKILKEDNYTERIEKIIERDFYPDIPQLQAQAEFLEAKEKNDLVALRRLHLKYGPKQPDTASSLYDTPASFETPDHHVVKPKKDREDPWKNLDAPSRQTKETVKDPTLDKFLAKNTSEDNASFDEILCETEKRERIKNAWLYDAEIEHQNKYQEKLALPNVVEQAAITNDTSSVDNWKYNTRNSLMYIPDGVEKSESEIIAEKKKPREIIHTNTRFFNKPFNECISKSKLQEAVAAQMKLKTGKIGPDGKMVVATPTPRVNGFGFVATPSPAPGVTDSPLMTWGEIEGTPFRLDGGSTPITHTPGPSFKIPAVPERDQIGMELAENASKAHRAKKQEALRRVTANFATPSPTFGKSNSDVINSLSPAARRLATNKLGIRTNSDKALRASYTPSPRKSPRLKNTPLSSTNSHRQNKRTPKTPVTPKVTPKLTPNRTTESSLTDNLLNLPKRARADDFF